LLSSARKPVDIPARNARVHPRTDVSCLRPLGFIVKGGGGHGARESWRDPPGARGRSREARIPRTRDSASQRKNSKRNEALENNEVAQPQLGAKAVLELLPGRGPRAVTMPHALRSRHQLKCYRLALGAHMPVLVPSGMYQGTFAKQIGPADSPPPPRLPPGPGFLSAERGRAA
jgi:hypothetical protein